MMKVFSTVVVAVSSAWMLEGCKNDIEKSAGDLDALVGKYKKAAQGSSVMQCEAVDDKDFSKAFVKLGKRAQNDFQNVKDKDREKSSIAFFTSMGRMLKARDECFRAYNVDPAVNGPKFMNALVEDIDEPQKTQCMDILRGAYNMA